MLGITLVTTLTWQMILLQNMERGIFLTIFNFLFNLAESQTVKQLRKIVTILKEDEDSQQSLIETNSRALNITKNHITKNRHMIN